MQSLKEKVVLVTGGSSGIGKELVLESLRRGAYVATCGRNLAALTQAYSEQDKRRLLLFQADVTKEEDCKNFIASCLKRFARIDVLVNNAGISMRALFREVDLSVLRELMEVNFWGVVNCTKAALPAIINSKGVVVGISSIAGYRGLPGRTGYSASKFAMQGFLESVRTELLPTGVHVMWVSPGFTASNIRKLARAADGQAQGETPLDEQKLMSAEVCAVHVLNAIERRKRTLVMTTQGKLTVWLNKLFPGLTDRLVFRHFQKESGSPLS
ncbi:MAG: SDR family oxidoreductase [Bacteroidetes bacterium]|nr:SDR family oxidoreductase [Bacteroidota bacterium]